MNIQLNRDKGFIDALAKFIDGLLKPDIDTDDPDDLDADEEGGEHLLGLVVPLR